MSAEDVGRSSRDRLWLPARAARRVILRTGRGALRPLWESAYALLIRSGASHLRRGGEEGAVYVHGSFGGGEPVLGISDVDLALVARSAEGQAGATQRWARLCGRVPWLPRIVYATAYDERELADAVADTVLTSGLSRGATGHAGLDRSLFHDGGRANPKMSLRLRPGLYGPLDDWRLVAGSDRRPVLPARDRESDLVGAWLELQHWWQYALLESTRPPTFRPPHLAYLCVKLIAEPIRIWLWLAHGVRVRGRREALERGLELLSEEEAAIRSAAELYDELPRDPDPPLAATLPAFVRLSTRIVRLLEAELAERMDTLVSLVGGPRDLPVTDADRADGRALCPPGHEPTFVPLVDWRARTLPHCADEVLVLVPGDPGDLPVLAAAAKAARPGFAPALCAPRVLVLPARSRSERPLALSALRGIQFAGSDPVTFALVAGDALARFPNVRGWSALDCARRAVAEHRGWLERAASATPPAQAFERLLTAARAALFLQSVDAGEPTLPLTTAAVVGVLGESPRHRGLAGEALAAYLGSRLEALDPPERTVAAFARLVRELQPYRTAELDPVLVGRWRSTSASKISS